MRPAVIVLGILMLGLILGAGCTGTGYGSPSWSVSGDGFLGISCPGPASPDERVLEKNASLTLSEVSFHNIDEEVFGLLAVPASPRGAVVLAPGAGVTKEDERGRVETYAMAGCAALVLDLRGNGGETRGWPFNPEADFLAFDRGSSPEVYKTVCDLSAARGVVTRSGNVTGVLHGGEQRGPVCRHRRGG